MRIIMLFIVAILLVSCKLDKNKPILLDDNLNKKNLGNQDIKLFASLLKDTINIGESPKVIVSMLSPAFKNSKSQIVAFSESQDSALLQLDEKLSNLYELDLYGFHNVSIDTSNRRLFKDPSRYDIIVAGRKMYKEGYNKSRVLVIEFIGKDPILDLKFDLDSIWFDYIEHDVYVTKGSLPN
jgi:hypothetical protein